MLHEVYRGREYSPASLKYTQMLDSLFGRLHHYIEQAGRSTVGLPAGVPASPVVVALVGLQVPVTVALVALLVPVTLALVALLVPVTLALVALLVPVTLALVALLVPVTLALVALQPTFHCSSGINSSRCTCVSWLSSEDRFATLLSFKAFKQSLRLHNLL